MVLTSSNGGYTVTPNHRQNRRRERPGSRTRRTITRKASIQAEYAEGLIDAFDLDVRLPSDRSNPSPLLRQNFDNAWQKWKAREEEQKLEREERERELLLELEREQLRLFGGEVDDDVSLFAPMLNVVWRLWGDIDYIDP